MTVHNAPFHPFLVSRKGHVNPTGPSMYLRLFVSLLKASKPTAVDVTEHSMADPGCLAATTVQKASHCRNQRERDL